MALKFSNARTGWLEVKQATGSAFDLRTAFRTEDGGASWTPQSEAEGLAPMDSGVDLNMATAAAGWWVAALGHARASAAAYGAKLPHMYLEAQGCHLS